MPDDYARLRDRMRDWRDEGRDEYRRGQDRDNGGYGGREDRDYVGYRSERDDRQRDYGTSGRDFGGRSEDEDRTVRRYRFSSRDEGTMGQGRSGDYGSRYGSSRNYDYGSGQGEDRDRGGYGAASLLTGDYGRWNEDYGRRDQGRQDQGRNRSGGQRDERGFFERAGDEMATWFGSESAERRRERDAYQGDEGAQHHRGRGPSGYRRSDARIAEDINDRLTEDAYVDASEVQVRVENGEVTLDGTVDSRMAKRRAEDIADGISGVSHVQNNLRVRQQAGMPSGTGRSGEMGQSSGGLGSGSYGSGTTGATSAGGVLGTAGTAGAGSMTETDTLTGSTTGALGTDETTGSGGTMGTRRSS